MKAFRSSAAVFLLCISIIACGCSGGDSEIVYRAYYAASLYPERFDAYAAAELAGSAEEFLNCAAEVRMNLSEQFVKTTEHCDGLPPEYQAACRDVDEVKVAMVIDAMAAVVRGEKKYTDTMPGVAAVMGKQVLGENQWIQIQQAVVPVFRPALVCD